MASLLERYAELMEDKDSVLCVGLDPALPRQRAKNIIASKYLDGADETEAKLNFCLDIINKTADSAIAAKPNEQYIKGFTTQQHRKLVEHIHSHNLLSVLDYKLGDIADTAESNLFWIHECGYDAITVHTQQGNLGEIVRMAHGYSPPIGIIALVLMSNPEAVKYMKEATLRGKPVYLAIAEDVKATGADGFVIGATGHVTEEDIRAVRSIVGEDKLALVPGVGEQKGDPEKVVRNIGRNVLINVGRAIIYSDDPGKISEEYNRMFNDAREKYSVNI